MKELIIITIASVNIGASIQAMLNADKCYKKTSAMLLQFFTSIILLGFLTYYIIHP